MALATCSIDKHQIRVVGFSRRSDKAIEARKPKKPVKPIRVDSIEFWLDRGIAVRIN
jgi:hypothetical protein